MEKARAAIFKNAKQPFELREYPIPEPKPNDLVVRVSRTNVCGSDLHIWRGETDIRGMGVGYDVILGHEMTGRVARLGNRVTSDALGESLREGDRVVFTYYLNCGHCRPCARGMPHACMMSLASLLRSCEQPPHFVGGFGEYYYIKAGQSVFKVPDSLPDSVVAGANCALSQVIHGLLEAKLSFGETVVVQGAGGLGLFACAVARDLGAHRVVAIDSVPARLELARQFGADDVIDMRAVPDARERVSRIQELTGGWGADVVVEVAGVPEAIPEGIRMLARGGRYLEMGSINPKMTYKADPSLLVGYNRSIIAVSLYPPFALKRAVDFLARASGRYPFAKLASHEYPLDDITRAFSEADVVTAEQRPITRASIVL